MSHGNVNILQKKSLTKKKTKTENSDNNKNKNIIDLGICYTIVWFLSNATFQKKEKILEPLSAFHMSYYYSYRYFYYY